MIQLSLTLESIQERLRVNTSLHAVAWWASLLEICSQGLDVSDVKNWPVWQTVTFGGKEKSVKRTLARNYSEKVLDRKLGKYWNHILTEMIHILPGEHTAELMVVPFEMLGFKDWVSIEELNKRVTELRLSLLPAEVIFQLPLLSGTNSESVAIAATPFEMLPGIKSCFVLGEEISPMFTGLKFPPASNVVCAKAIN
jgi:hypothetical protein